MKPEACLTLVLCCMTVKYANAGDPEFEMYRWNEDYRYLADEPGRSVYNRFKYLPLGEQSHLSFGGSLRERLNVYDNDRFGLPGTPDGYLLLHRLLLHGDLHVSDHFRVFIEMGNHLSDGDDLQPGPFDEDSIDLTQAFTDVTWYDSQLRIGRQEMALGSGRLVSVRDGPNVRRAFDGVRFDTTLRDINLRLFGLQEVKVKESGFDNYSNDDESLWGIYSISDTGATRADIYYLGLYRGGARYAQGTANETRHSLGARLFGKHGAWDWNYEFIYQFGDFGPADISAWTAASITGYTFRDTLWSPRIALSANIASGDDDPNDRTLGTFNPLYPNMTYFEEASILAPQNFFNIEPEITVHPTDRLSLSVDWNFFWRVEGSDAVYVRGLNPLTGTPTARGHFIAHVPSLSIDYQLGRHVAMDISYSHFFAGEVINNAGGNDIDFFKTEFTITF